MNLALSVKTKRASIAIRTISCVCVLCKSASLCEGPLPTGRKVQECVDLAVIQII